MQGRLLGKGVTVRIVSRCAACRALIRIDVDEELRWSAPGMESTPLILEPSVDWTRFVGPSILHAY